MELRKGYKQTEVGIIPEDWQVLTIDDLVNNGFIDKPLDGNHGNIHPKSTDFVESGIPFVMANNVYNGAVDLENCHFIRKEQADKLQKGFSITGDVLFTHKGTVGNVAIVEKISTEYIMLTPQVTYYRVKNYEEISNVFIQQYFLSGYFQKLIKSVSGGGTRAYIGITSQRQLPFILPPTKAEQTAIATALSDMDDLIKSLSTLIEKKKAIKQGVMQELLKPNPDSNREGWEISQLGKIAEIKMGQSPLSIYYNTQGQGLPLIQGNADIDNRKTIVRSYTSVVTKKGFEGDIIMSVRAPVGEISKATFDCCLGRGVCSIKYKNDYIYHYLIYFEKSWARYSTGSTFDSVTSEQVKELEIPIPKEEVEQERIANILSDIDAEIQALEQNLTKYQMLKQGMIQELLTGKTRLV